MYSNNVCYLSDPDMPQRQQLIDPLHQQALKQLSLLLGDMFNKADDALFELSEKAEDNATQSMYFDAIREVRRRRSKMEKTFAQQIANRFADLTRLGQAPEPSPAVTLALSKTSLSLLEDEELEESLAVRSMTSRANNQLHQPITSLMAKLATLCGGRSIDARVNPVSPENIAESFRSAAQALQIDIKAKLILYKLFDRSVMVELAKVYGPLNHILVHAGVRATPQANGQPVKSPLLTDGIEPMSLEPSPQAPMHPPLETEIESPSAPSARIAAPAEAIGMSQLMQVLNELMRQGQWGPSPGVLFPSNAMETLSHTEQRPGSLPPHECLTYPATEVLSALSILQHRRGSLSHPPSDPGRARISLQEVISREIYVEGHAEEGKRRLGRLERETIDMLELMFRFILDDRNLPEQIRALIARLQVPFIKVGIIDRSLLRKRHHPAWDLLNEMARASIGWNEEDVAGRDALYAEIERIVSRILEEFEDNVGIFAELRNEFNAYRELERSRAKLIEQRTQEREQAKAKIEQAKQEVIQAISERLAGRVLPSEIEELLKKRWSRVLLITYMKRELDSAAWLKGLGVVERLVWSMQPKTSEQELKALREEWPQLVNDFRRGLTDIAHDPCEIKESVEELERQYRRRLEAPLSPPAALPEVPEVQQEEVAPVADEERTLVLPQTEYERVMQDDKYLNMVESLSVGTWLEFIDKTGKPLRAKLSAKISRTRTYVFVNRIGMKLGEKSVTELTEEIRRGTASVLNDSELFERILSTAFSRLKA